MYINYKCINIFQKIIKKIKKIKLLKRRIFMYKLKEIFFLHKSKI